MKQQLPYCNYESIVNIKCKHQQVLCIFGLKIRKMTDIPSKKARICEESLILINNVLPPEILKKILEWLDIKNLVIARLTCKRWKLIIDNCNIMEEALSKFSKSNKLKDFAETKNIHVFLIYRKDLLHAYCRRRNHFC